MPENFAAMRQEMSKQTEKTHNLELRIKSLEEQIKWLRADFKEDFKWIKIYLCIGIGIGLILGIVFGGNLTSLIR